MDITSAQREPVIATLGCGAVSGLPVIDALHHFSLADFPVLIWLDERIGELAPINVQFALSGSGTHDRGTPGISYAYGSMPAKYLYAAMEAQSE